MAAKLRKARRTIGFYCLLHILLKHSNLRFVDAVGRLDGVHVVAPPGTRRPIRAAFPYVRVLRHVAQHVVECGKAVGVGSDPEFAKKQLVAGGFGPLCDRGKPVNAYRRETTVLEVPEPPVSRY